MSKDSKPPHRRKISRFLCQEMLYDFVTDRLDPDRAQAVRDYLESDEQVREELECLQQGLKYTEELSHTGTSGALVEQLKHCEPVTQRLAGRLFWTKWPPSLRLGAEALAVSTLVAVAMSFIPWQKIKFLHSNPTGQIEIARVDARKKPEDADVAVAPTAPPPKTDSAEVESKPVDDKPQVSEAADAKTKTVATAPTTVATTPPTPSAKPEASAKAEALAAAPIIPTQVTKGMPPSVRLAPGAKPVASDSPNALELKNDSGKPRGVVFKAFMTLKDLNNLTPKIADLIRQNGGQRAGEVELGWRRETGSYFHFTLPESNYQQLLTSLKAYGAVQIFEEPHRRVMPRGKIRIILWVSDGDK